MPARSRMPAPDGAACPGRRVMPLEALILDYGNVLSHPQPSNWCESLASQIGVPLSVFRDAYWQHRPLYDAGLPAAEYWRRALDTVGHSSAPWNLGAITARLVEADVASWTEYREEVWRLTESFRHAGGRTAFLSTDPNRAPSNVISFFGSRPFHIASSSQVWQSASMWVDAMPW